MPTQKPERDSVTEPRTEDSGPLDSPRVVARVSKAVERVPSRELARVCSRESWKAHAVFAANVAIGRLNVLIGPEAQVQPHHPLPPP